MALKWRGTLPCIRVKILFLNIYHLRRIYIKKGGFFPKNWKVGPRGPTVWDPTVRGPTVWGPTKEIDLRHVGYFPPETPSSTRRGKRLILVCL